MTTLSKRHFETCKPKKTHHGSDFHGERGPRKSSALFILWANDVRPTINIICQKVKQMSLSVSFHRHSFSLFLLLFPFHPLIFSKELFEHISSKTHKSLLLFFFEASIISNNGHTYCYNMKCF